MDSIEVRSQLRDVITPLQLIQDNNAMRGDLLSYKRYSSANNISNNAIIFYRKMKFTVFSHFMLEDVDKRGSVFFVFDFKLFEFYVFYLVITITSQIVDLFNSFASYLEKSKFHSRYKNNKLIVQLLRRCICIMDLVNTFLDVWKQIQFDLLQLYSVQKNLTKKQRILFYHLLLQIIPGDASWLS